MEKLQKALDERLEKAKYTKRTGSPGNYKYEYGSKKGNSSKSDKKDDKPKKENNLSNEDRKKAMKALHYVTWSVSYDSLSEDKKKEVDKKAIEMTTKPYITEKFINGTRTSHDPTGNLYFDSKEEAEEYKHKNEKHQGIKSSDISFYVSKNKNYKG